MNFVGHTKKLALALFATLVHASLLSIKFEVSQLGAAQELKDLLAEFSRDLPNAY